MKSIAWPVALFDGPMTQPLEPVCSFRSFSIVGSLQCDASQAAIARKAVLIVVVTNESECVPRFDFRQQSRANFGMTSEVVVETCGESVAQRTHMSDRAARILLALIWGFRVHG